jgi:hypothetical protein
MRVVNINVEPFDVYGGRAGRGYDGYFGNPFKALREADRDKAIALHRDYFYKRIARDDHFRRACLELRGKRVGCFCKPKACHLDVIAKWVNAQI